MPPRRRQDRMGDVGPTTSAIELKGDQLGELGRDVCHRRFCSAQAASRAEQGTDIAESFIRRVVHDGDEQVAREECRKLFVGYALSSEAARHRQALVLGCWTGSQKTTKSPKSLKTKGFLEIRRFISES